MRSGCSERLRLSNDEHRQLETYGELLSIVKTRREPLDAIAIRRLVAEHGVGPLDNVLTAIAGEPLPILSDDAMPAFARYRDGAERVPVFPLRGADLIEKGLPAGPQIGRLLSQARDVWLSEGCRTDETAARLLLERVLSGSI